MNEEVTRETGSRITLTTAWSRNGFRWGADVTNMSALIRHHHARTSFAGVYKMSKVHTMSFEFYMGIRQRIQGTASTWENWRLYDADEFRRMPICKCRKNMGIYLPGVASSWTAAHFGRMHHVACGWIRLPARRRTCWWIRLPAQIKYIIRTPKDTFVNDPVWKGRYHTLMMSLFLYLFVNHFALFPSSSSTHSVMAFTLLQ